MTKAAPQDKTPEAPETPEAPNLSNQPLDVQQYIHTLEDELAELRTELDALSKEPVYVPEGYEDGEIKERAWTANELPEAGGIAWLDMWGVWKGVPVKMNFTRRAPTVSAAVDAIFVAIKYAEAKYHLRPALPPREASGEPLPSPDDLEKAGEKASAGSDKKGFVKKGASGEEPATGSNGKSFAVKSLTLEYSKNKHPYLRVKGPPPWQKFGSFAWNNSWPQGYEDLDQTLDRDVEYVKGEFPEDFAIAHLTEDGKKVDHFTAK